MCIICIFVYIQAFFWVNVLRLQQTAKEVPGRYSRDSSRMRDKELQTFRENTLDVLVGIQHVSPPSMGHPFSARWYCVTTIDLVQSADGVLSEMWMECPNHIRKRWADDFVISRRIARSPWSTHGRGHHLLCDHLIELHMSLSSGHIQVVLFRQGGHLSQLAWNSPGLCYNSFDF